jgi:putative PIN family toxin of toxin-antitoxin system
MLDTNVLASGIVAFATPERAPARLLHLWREGRYSLIVSADIEIELGRALGSPYFRHRLTPEQVAEALHLLTTEAVTTSISVDVKGVATHPEDDLILAAAISSGAHYLVTGDIKLLRLGTFSGVSILSARDFLEVLAQNVPE